MEVLLTIRKRQLWPISTYAFKYSEDDLFDMIEFLYQHVSKPINGTMHSYNDCGMHWETFNKAGGRREYIKKVNQIIRHYDRKFELSKTGEILRSPEAGFEPIFNVDVPSVDANVVDRINAAMNKFRKHGSSIDDQRQAVRDLADVLEYIKPKVKALLTSNDESDLFNIANNFGIRHHNDKHQYTHTDNRPGNDERVGHGTFYFTRQIVCLLYMPTHFVECIGQPA